MINPLELEQAIALIAEKTELLGLRDIHVSELNGRPLAADVFAAADQPPFPASPLDGYALRAADSVGAIREAPVRLQVVGKHFAGDAGETEIGPGQAVRLFTGAVIPKGADCVLRQEDTDEGEDTVSIYKTLSPWENYVHPGSDFREDEKVLSAGTVPDYAALGLMAAAGISRVTVRRYPKVAVLSTGDELVQPGMWPLPPGKIYNSNPALISARLAQWNLSASTAHVGDDPEKIAIKIKEFLLEHEVVITTGGVSVGQKDFLPQALALLGAEIVFHGVCLKPGAPVLFAKLDNRYVLALSGNPSAAATTLELLGRPMFYCLTNDPRLESRRVTAVLDTPFVKKGHSRRFLRARYADGHVALPEGGSSGGLTGLVGCNCLVDIPADTDALAPGDRVSIILL